MINVKGYTLATHGSVITVSCLCTLAMTHVKHSDYAVLIIDWPLYTLQS